MVREVESRYLPSSPKRSFPRMTYEQFIRTVPDDVHAEWVEGEVVPMTPVSRDHNELSAFFLALLRHYVEAQNVGKIFCEPFQMKTGPNLPGRSPDLLFVSKKRLSQLKRNHLQGPADLVIEIISPESRARDRGESSTSMNREACGNTGSSIRCANRLSSTLWTKMVSID